MANLNIIAPWSSEGDDILDYVRQISGQIAIFHNIITECESYANGDDNVRVLHPSDPDARTSLLNGKNLFHFSDNSEFAYQVFLFIKYGGSIVLHDFSLGSLCRSTDMLIPGFFEYFLQMENPNINYKLFDILRRMDRATLGYNEVNLISWLRPARNIIVPSQAAAQIVRGYLPDNDVQIVPFFAYQHDLNKREILRLQCEFKYKNNLPSGEITVFIAGDLGRPKQYEAFFKSLLTLNPAVLKKFRFLIQSKDRKGEDTFLSKLIANSHLVKQSLLVDNANDRAVSQTLAASDLVIDIKCSMFAAYSEIVSRAIGHGCVVVSSDGQYCSLLNTDSSITHLFKKRNIPNIKSLLSAINDGQLEFIEVRAAVLHDAVTKLHPKRIAHEYMRVIGYDI